ncbi:MAG: hypothetical protein JWP84_3742 [Tardiphaga sp.]|jgi:hypothetical protein|nr:hypothetical protein [Tardiphaga sp.]
MAEYSGMTVNDRLVMSGMHINFDETAKQRDRTKMIQILVALEMSEKGAAAVADAILADPAKYGL